MKKTYSRWNNEEIKNLFNFVSNQTQKGQTRANAFSLFAKQSNRKPNSVRNYYYLELEFLKKNPKQAQELAININLHQKQEPNFFSNNEAQKCMQDINNLVSKGHSVRKACLILSDGNIEQMVRLQNKYRSLQKEKQKENTPKPNNIISMPQRAKGLTDQEINSLFMGLLKLIKASAKQESLNDQNKKTEDANQQLRKALVAINEKEKELKKLREGFELLKQENTKAKQTITNLRAETASLIANSNQKMQALKKYAGNIKTGKTKKALE